MKMTMGEWQEAQDSQNFEKPVFQVISKKLKEKKKILESHLPGSSLYIQTEKEFVLLLQLLNGSIIPPDIQKEILILLQLMRRFIESELGFECQFYFGEILSKIESQNH